MGDAVDPRIWRGFERQLNEVANLPGVEEWWAVRRAWYSDALSGTGAGVRVQWEAET